MPSRESKINGTLSVAHPDTLTVGEIAARAHVSPGRVKIALRALDHAGLARRRTSQRPDGTTRVAWQAVLYPNVEERSARRRAADAESKRLRNDPTSGWTAKPPPRDDRPVVTEERRRMEPDYPFDRDQTVIR